MPLPPFSLLLKSIAERHVPEWSEELKSMVIYFLQYSGYVVPRFGFLTKEGLKWKSDSRVPFSISLSCFLILVLARDSFCFRQHTARPVPRAEWLTGCLCSAIPWLRL